MKNPKYIVFEEIFDYPCVIDLPMIIFPAMINHSKIAKKIESIPISAGFIDIKTGYCYGGSYSLKLKSNNKRDNILFKNQYGGIK